MLTITDLGEASLALKLKLALRVRSAKLALRLRKHAKQALHSG